MIEEVMTFARDEAGGDASYRLTRFTTAYTDRRTAGPARSLRILTTADFGNLRFEDMLKTGCGNQGVP